MRCDSSSRKQDSENWTAAKLDEDRSSFGRRTLANAAQIVMWSGVVVPIQLFPFCTFASRKWSGRPPRDWASPVTGFKVGRADLCAVCLASLGFCVRCRAGARKPASWFSSSLFLFALSLRESGRGGRRATGRPR